MTDSQYWDTNQIWRNLNEHCYYLTSTKFVISQIDASCSCPCDFNPTGTPRRIDVNSTWILRRYVEDQIWTNLHVVFTYFFDVVSLIEKPTSCPRTFVDVILMVEKSTLFSRTIFDVISFAKLSTVFLITFFDVILLSNNPLCLQVLFLTKFWWIRCCCWKVVS